MDANTVYLHPVILLVVQRHFSLAVGHDNIQITLRCLCTLELTPNLLRQILD